MDLDTLKSVAVGSGGITIQFLDMLPEMVRVGVGVVTIIYFGYKIALLRKQLKNLIISTDLVNLKGTNTNVSRSFAI